MLDQQHLCFIHINFMAARYRHRTNLQQRRSTSNVAFLKVWKCLIFSRIHARVDFPNYLLKFGHPLLSLPRPSGLSNQLIPDDYADQY